MYCQWLLCLLLYCAVWPFPAQSGKILLVPFQFPSHITQATNIGRALLKSGHQIYMLMADTMPLLEKLTTENPEFTVITHASPKADFYTGAQPLPFDEYFSGLMIRWSKDWIRMEEYGSPMVSFCHNALTDKQTFQKLKDLNFDIAMVDSISQVKCYFVLMYRLGIPYTSWITAYEPWALKNPALPSFVPQNIGPPMTEQMTFWQRLENLWHVIDWISMPPDYYKDSFYTGYFGNSPPVPFHTLVSASLVWFIDSDQVMDYPRPVMPNEVMIGGLTTKPAQQLPTHLADFVNAAEHGVILVSLGAFSPDVATDIFKEAFKRVKQRVVWRLKSKIPHDMPDNVMVSEWLPQNDLLGHPKVKLFITHCGANGQFEALYHAVPMIGFPLFADQFHNCLRASYHGLGLQLHPTTATSASLVHAINTILTNHSYYNNIKHRSQIFRDRPMSPTQTIVYWMEHVMTYGGQHLHSYALDMPWYEYLMVDILLCVMAAISVIIYLMLTVGRLFLNYFITKGKEKTN